MKKKSWGTDTLTGVVLIPPPLHQEVGVKIHVKSRVNVVESDPRQTNTRHNKPKTNKH